MALEKESVKWCKDGEPSLLVMSLPSDIAAEGSPPCCFACPIASRSGGLLLGLPDSSVSSDVWSTEECLEGSLTGLCKRFEIVFVQESDSGGIRPAGFSAGIVAVDFSDDALYLLREYDPVADEGENIAPFSGVNPVAVPDHVSLHRVAMEWILAQSDTSRVHFYSAREEQEPTPAAPPVATKKAAAAPKRVTNAALIDTINALADQVKLLSSRQDTLDQNLQKPGSTVVAAKGQELGTRGLPSLSGGLGIVPGPPATTFSKAVAYAGPPPKVRAAIPTLPVAPLVPQQDEPLDPLAAQGEMSPIASAIVQQGAAITALVSHLTAHSNDAIADLSASSSGVGIRGVQRRERLQGELAGRTGNFFLTMMQQVHKKLHPSRPVPKQEEDLSSLSLLTYLKEHGGYRGQREMGLVMWLLGHVVDLMACQDYEGAKEHLALMVVAVEQAATDGNWNLGYMLTLLEEPPLSLFQERLAVVSPHGRPFSPLVPPQWAAAVLSYVKEMELLQTRKKETSSASSSAKVAAVKSGGEGDPPAPISPKRKPRFPRKPKASPEA